MRIRTIKPEFFVDERIGDLSPLHRIFFIGLWSAADRRGRLVDQPRRLKVQILPYDNADAAALLSDLAEAGLVVRYSVDAARYVQVVGFERHQRPHAHEQESEIPAIPEGFQPSTTKVVPEHDQGSAKTQPCPSGREGNGREGNGYLDGGASADARQPRRSKAGRRTQFPGDLTLTPFRQAQAAGLGLPAEDIPRQWGLFADHHRAAGSLMADWDAAWRKWVGKSLEFSRARARAGPRDRARDEIAAWVRGDGAEAAVETTAREVKW